jgi:hypothetical protein
MGGKSAIPINPGKEVADGHGEQALRTVWREASGAAESETEEVRPIRGNRTVGVRGCRECDPRNGVRCEAARRWGGFEVDQYRSGLRGRGQHDEQHQAAEDLAHRGASSGDAPPDASRFTSSVDSSPGGRKNSSRDHDIPLRRRSSVAACVMGSFIAPPAGHTTPNRHALPTYYFTQFLNRANRMPVGPGRREPVASVAPATGVRDDVR